MIEGIKPNLNHLIDEFLERAGRSCAYKVEGWLRENELETLPEEGIPTWKIERLAEALEENIHGVFYELFEVYRTEDASREAIAEINRGLFPIQRALESIARHPFK